MYREDESKMRTVEKYDKQMTVIEMSTNVNLATTCGIKRYCALNDLRHFHIMKNPSVDIMHDLNEGVIPFLLKYLINYCHSEKIIKEEALIKLIQYHDYGILNQKNVPSQVNMDKRNLNQNTSQSLCLFRNIPFILHQFREKLQSVWSCVESLLKIVQISYSWEITEKDLQTLEQCVYDHLSSVRHKLKIVGNLIPKHHFLTHYATTIRVMGPLRQMSTIHFERKHKLLKNFAKNTQNFRNISKSLAIKHQQATTKCKGTYDDRISSGKKKKLVSMTTLKDIIEISEIDVIYEIKWLQYNSFRFISGLLILHDTFLYEIENLLIVNEEYFLLCFLYERTHFDTFLNSIGLKKVEPKHFVLIKFDSLENKVLYEKKNLNGDLYVIADTLCLDF